MALDNKRTDRKVKVAKKRKAEPLDEHEEQPKKQKPPDLTMSEIDFKNRLKDDSSIIDGLEEFVRVAEAYRDGQDCIDIVSRYCSSSPECSEIFAILDMPHKNPNNLRIASAYECLTIILRHVQADENSKLWSTADFIVEKMATSYLEQMYSYLKPDKTSTRVKKALHLLISMVTLNKKAKRAVQTKFMFDNDSFFMKFFQGRDRKDPEDVRSCIVLFTMSFIVDGDDTLINTMVQQKGFIQMTLSGLIFDPKEMVMDVLATLLDKVVLNEAVERPAKLQLFNARVLIRMCDLYDWEGPQGWKNDKKSFLTDVDFLEERSAVSSLVHRVLLAVCSPKKHGLAFLDKSLGTGTRNFNPLLNRLLHYLSTRLDNPLKRNLAANILNFCPDQLSHFLSGWGKSLTMDKRTVALDFLVETYKTQTPVPTFLASHDTMPRDVDRVLSLMTTYYLPCDGISASIGRGIKSNNLAASHQCLVLIQVILHNVTTIVSHIASNKIPHIPAGGFSTSLLSAFSSCAVKALPPPSVLFGCVENILRILSNPQKLEAIGTEVDLVDHVSTVLKILGLYQRLCPTLLSDRPSDVARLVEAVGRLQAIIDAAMEGVANDTESKVVLPQLDLLKLLSETDVETLPLVEGGLLENLLRSARSLKEQHREETVSLIYKVLTSLAVLSGHKEELSLWIGQALASETKWTSFSPIKFLSGVLGRVISNPVPYVEKVMEVTSGTATPDKGAKKGMKDRALQEILSMADEDLDLTVPLDQLEVKDHSGTVLPFSPLTVAALEKLGSDDEAWDYVSGLLVSILHSQSDPVPYSLAVTGSWVKGHTGVREYFDYWAGSRKKLVSAVNLRLATPYSLTLLNWYMGGDKDDLDLGVMDDDVEDIPEEQKWSCLRQAMMYLEHCFSDSFALGPKLKCVKVLRKVITNLFTSYVSGLRSSRSSGLESKMEVDEEENDDKTVSENALRDHHDKNTLEKISTAALFIANNAVVKENFLSSPVDNLPSPSKSNDKQKLKQVVTKLMCDTLAVCKDVKLLPSCHDVLQVYLDRALDGLGKKGKDKADCLTTVQTISCHVHLPVINKCVATFLQFPATDIVVGDLTDKDSKGQKSQELTPSGETFLELLNTWIQTLTLYHVTEVKDAALLLTQTTPPIHDDINMQSGKETNISSDGADTTSKILPTLQSSSSHPSSHVTDVHLNTTGLEQLFNLLLVCPNFDAPICSLVHHLPHVGICCSPDVFKKLIKHFPVLARERQSMVENLVSSQDSFHQLGGSYILKHAKSVVTKGHFGLVRAYLCKGGGNAETIATICQQLLSGPDLLSCVDDRLWACLHAMIDRQDLPANFLQDLFQTVTSFIPGNRSSTQLHHFSVLNAICQHLCSNRHGNANKMEGDFLELLLKFITHLSKRADRNPDLEDKLTDLAKVSFQRGGHLSRDFLASAWPGFVKSLLKHFYTRPASLDLLALLMSRIFGDQGQKVTDCGNVDPSMTFQMCVSHTTFLSTLMSVSDAQAKTSLVNLLHTLFTLQPSCINKELLTPFTGAYSASLTLTDQRLLSMMNACLLAEDNSKSQLPVLWGKAYLDHKATSKSMGRGGGQADVSMDAVLGEIDSQKMEETILHFAMRRKTKAFDVCDPGDLMSKPDCYDPSYLLRVCLQILSPEKIVQVRAFSEKGCLGFLLICLSSKQDHCRLMAYKCLNDFYAHLENSPSPARHEFAFILDVLNASRSKNGQRLPYVLSLYLSRAIKLVLDPSDHMYLRIMKFLCHRPQIDLSTVPEFYKFFFSPETQYLKERTWMLTLLRDGLRENDDYQMYRKSFVFKHLMSFHSSCVSDKSSKVIVLELFRNACGQSRAVKDLLKDHGFVPWLSCVVSGLEKRLEQVEVVADILDTVCKSLGVRSRVTDSLGVGGLSQTKFESSDSSSPKSGKEIQNASRSTKIREDNLGKVDSNPKETEQVDVDRLDVPRLTLVSLEMVVDAFNAFVCGRRRLAKCV